MANTQPPATTTESSSSAGPSSPAPEKSVFVDEYEDEEHVRECLRKAEELKKEGTESFKQGRWNEAMVAYRSGLGQLPSRKEKKKTTGKGKERQTSDEDDEIDEGDGSKSDKAKDEGEEDGEEEEPKSELEVECAKVRAVMNANIGACHFKLGDYKEVVQACTEALLDDPNYVKVLQRRATSNEKLDTWSSLTSAQEDYNALLKLLPPSCPQVKDVQRSLRLIAPRVEAAQKKEMGEMMDKLKSFGNSILGNFGLSTDNFKLEPNGQGGYSMNFAR